MTFSSQISMSGFSQSQIDAFLTLFGATLSTIETPEPPPAPYTSNQQAVTMPQLIQPAKKKQEHKPLQQATTENVVEKLTEKTVDSNVTTVNTGLVPITLHQSTMRYDKDAPPINNNNAPLLVSLLAILPTFSLFGSFLTSLPGYIHEAEDMEVTGQG